MLIQPTKRFKKRQNLLNVIADLQDKIDRHENEIRLLEDALASERKKRYSLAEQFFWYKRNSIPIVDIKADPSEATPWMS